MNYLVHPSNIVSRALGIDSFKQMISDEQVQFSELVDTSVQIADEWTNDWDEDQGFGSSDGTYLLKDFIDTIISNFTNSVTVEPASEGGHGHAGVCVEYLFLRYQGHGSPTPRVSLPPPLSAHASRMRDKSPICS